MRHAAPLSRVRACWSITMFSTQPRQAIHTDRCSAPVAGYSQGFQVGSLVFVSGQLPLDPQTNLKVGDGDVAAEARQVLRNLMAVLEAAGCGPQQVASAVIYLTDINSLEIVDAVWREFFTDSTAFPSRAVVEVRKLVLDIQVEISAIAVRDS